MADDTENFTDIQIVIRDRVIDDAVASVHTHEKREFRKEGALKGLSLCFQMASLADFESVLAIRHAQETALRIKQQPDVENYWRYRVATAQLEFVYERMKVACGSGGSTQALSGRAVQQVFGIIRNMMPGGME